VARLLARLLLVLAVVAGSAAMHTLFDAPMAQAMPVARVAMHVSSPAMSTNGEVAAVAVAEASPATGIEDSASVPSPMTSMDDAAMHACLFRLIAAVLLAFALAAFGDWMPVWAPRVAPRRWRNTAMSGNDRILALQVLRI
jgi:hypothetical protein